MNETELLNDTINATANTTITPQQINSSISQSLWSVATKAVAGLVNFATEKITGHSAGMSEESAAWLLLLASLLLIAMNLKRLLNFLEKYGLIFIGGAVLYIIYVMVNP